MTMRVTAVLAVVALDGVIQHHDLNLSILAGHHYQTHHEGPPTVRHDVRGMSLVLIQYHDLNRSILAGHHCRTQREGPPTGRHDMRGMILVLESDIPLIQLVLHPEVEACPRYDKVAHLASPVVVVVVPNREGVENARAAEHGGMAKSVHPAEHQAR
jgi:hypothetical protein